MSVITSYSIHYTKLYDSGVSQNSQVWMSHGDTITKLPDNYKIIASTADVKVAAYAVEGENTYGVITSYSIHYTKLYETGIDPISFCNKQCFNQTTLSGTDYL